MNTIKNDPTIERLIRWPALDEPGTFIVRCSCQRWSATGTAREIAAASRAHDDSPWRNHITSIYGRVTQPCPNDSAETATSSTTATPPTPCAAPAASQQPPKQATHAPTPQHAATAPSTSNSASSCSNSSSPASHAPDADNPSPRKTTPTSATPTDSTPTGASNTQPVTGQQADAESDNHYA